MRILGAVVSDPDLERFRSKCSPQASGCVLWTGSTMWKGYGRFFVDGKTIRAHRFSYALSGDLPSHLQLDHLCRNRLCVNPLHLEAVTARQNVMRSPIAPARINAEKTHCPKGHSYSGANLFVRTNGIRECRECGRAESRRYQARKRAERKAARAATA
jgi:hypothetical protein